MIDKLTSTKKYIVASAQSVADDIVSGYIGDYFINENIQIKLLKELGVPQSVYYALQTTDGYVAKSVLQSMIHSRKLDSIVILVDEDTRGVLGYSLDSDKLPVLNSDFMNRVNSFVEANNFFSISETYYEKDSTTSYVLLSRESPMIVTENYVSGESKVSEYKIGALIVNDEVGTTTCRLVYFIDGQPVYLPSNYYSPSRSRYKRSTSDSVEALEVFLLKIAEDFREDELYSKIYDVHFKYRANKEAATTYEEYNSLLKALLRIPTFIEDNSALVPIIKMKDMFEEKYPSAEDRNSSYIWRCTAIGSISIGNLVATCITMMNEVDAPYVEYYSVREILGSYICTSRIVDEIAKEDRM